MSGLAKKMNAKFCNHWKSYDLCSMIKITSIGGDHYFMTFINNYSQYTWVYFLKFKSPTYQCFKSFKIVVKTLRNDRGGKYLFREFVTFCNDQGIKRKFIKEYTSHQNGVVE
jgi:hypothetical protein